MVLKTGDVLATRDDGATLLYDSDDEYGRPLGRIRQGKKTYDVHPVMALLARGGWDETKKPVTAAGDSWRWQLRASDGEWIEMGSEVKWLARGRWLHGLVVGSPSPGIATVEEAHTKILRDLPAARLEVVRGASALIDQVDSTRNEKGLIDWRSLDLGGAAGPKTTPTPEVFKATHITSPENAARLRESGFTSGTKGLGSDWGTGIYLGTDPGSAEHYQRFIPGGEAVPVEVDLKNPARVVVTYDPTNNDGGLASLTWQIPGLREELLKRNGIANVGMTSYDMQGIGTKIPEVLNSEALTPSLQALGYDGLVLHEVDVAGMPTITDYIGGSQIVAFDPDTVHVVGGKVQKAEAPSAEFWSDVLDKPGPETIRAHELKPGDIYQDGFNRQDNRVISIDSDDGEYLQLTAIVTSGKNIGAVIHPNMTRSLKVEHTGNVPEQDFTRDVIDPLAGKLAALREKYPEGIAAALDQAVTPPSEPRPEMSDRLKAMLNDTDYVRWMYQEGAARDRLRALEEQDLYSPETLVAKDELDALHYDRIGGKIRDTNVMLLNYQFRLKDWSDRERAARDTITPHSDAAKQILADVRAIGQDAHIGIEIEVAKNLPKPPPVPVTAKSFEAFDALRQEDDWRKATWKMRRELAQRVIAETVGATTSTSQTWTPTKPRDSSISKYVRDLTPDEKAAMTAGLLRYPASWVERFDRNQYTTSMATRGWHNEGIHHIALSDYDGKGVTEDGSSTWATIVHEFGHGMEDSVPGLAMLETVWWHDRMGENSPKKYYLADDARFPVPDKPGPGQKNVARPTAQSYSMKMYGNVYSRSETKFWEAFTTGVQEVLGDGKTNYTSKWSPDGYDADLWDVTMGALLTLDPTIGATDAGDSLASPTP